MEHFHLGVLRSVKGSLPRTTYQLSKGRSSFFALNRFESRFVCLHPITALRLYLTFSLPRLLYGAELWNVSQTEVNMFNTLLPCVVLWSTGAMSSFAAQVLFYVLHSLLESPSTFVDFILGVQYIEDCEFQSSNFCLLFISSLRRLRSDLLIALYPLSSAS